MAAPQVTASLNKSAYTPGEQMTLTVTYGDPDTRPLTVSIVVTDSEGNASEQVSVSAVIDPLTVAVTDDSGRVWSRVSDSGSVAVFQATA